jgi:hypothetical protein
MGQRRQTIIHFPMEMRTAILTIAYGQVSAVLRAQFVSDRMLYIALRDRWCDIVLNAHAPTEDKSDDTKNSLLRFSSESFAFPSPV